MRHGRENAFRTVGAQKPHRHLEPLCPLPHGAQTGHDEPPRKAFITKKEGTWIILINVPSFLYYSKNAY